MTVKTSISGAIGDTLTATVSGDHYGAQVIDVQFFNDSELTTPVTPTGGAYTIEWSTNGRDWNKFDNSPLNIHAADPVGDWQAHGYIGYVKFTPISITGASYWEVTYRAHKIGNVGTPSGLTSQSPYFNVQNVASIGAYEFGALTGQSYGTSKELTVAAGASISVKVVHNAEAAVIAFSRAKGLTIEYYNGNVSGNLIDTSAGVPLNQTLTPAFELAFEYYDGEASGTHILSNVDEMQEPIVINGGGTIEFKNQTSEDITVYFSIGVSYLGDLTAPYMLTSTTQLESTTEMSTYNG